MKSPLPKIVVPATFLGVLAWAVAGLPEAQLEAATVTAPVMVDTDGDGLDDILETRFGTLPDDVDSDGDTLNDFDELLMGLDPTTANDLNNLPAVSPNLRIEAYSSGSDLVLQVAALRQNRVRGMHLYWATPNIFHEVRLTSLAQMPHDVRTLSSSIPNYELEIYRVKLPIGLFLSQPAVAVAVKGMLDGQDYADQIQLSNMTGTLMEWRPDGMGVASAQGSGGGLFPTDPGGSMPGEVRAGEVCVQTLAQIGALGGGQVLYQVSDSYCGFMPNAICFSSCAAAVGDSVVGIDIIGLLAN